MRKDRSESAIDDIREQILAIAQRIPGTTLTFPATSTAQPIHSRKPIYRVGDETSRLCVVLEGLVSLDSPPGPNGDAFTFDFRSAGEVFGFVAPSRERVDYAYPCALTGAVVQRIEQDVFVAEGAATLSYMLGGLLNRNQQAHSSIALEKNTKVKIAQALLSVFYVHGHVCHGYGQIKVPLVYSELRRYTGVSSNSLRKALNALKEERLIKETDSGFSFVREGLENFFRLASAGQ